MVMKLIEYILCFTGTISDVLDLHVAKKNCD